jgi:hypothetical protein
MAARRRSQVELINDPKRAEVVITYLLGIQRAVLVDKRRLGAVGPFIGVFPQDQLGLEGRPTAEPLTPEIVHSIERLQVMPREQRLVESYFHQLLTHIGGQLQTVRPTMPLARFVCIGPHFGPVLFFAVSDLWRGLLHGLERRGETDVLDAARNALRELHGWEATFAERIDPEQVDVLHADLRRQAVYRAYR